MQQSPNPILGPNRFKLGLFSANCDGGASLSLAPERWPCEWDDVLKLAVMAMTIVFVAMIDFISHIVRSCLINGGAGRPLLAVPMNQA